MNHKDTVVDHVEDVKESVLDAGIGASQLEPCWMMEIPKEKKKAVALEVPSLCYWSIFSRVKSVASKDHSGHGD